MDITYCTGDPTLKRKEFRKLNESGTIYADNDEVSAFFRLNGVNYCVCGALSFENLSIEEFIRYSRAFIDVLPLNRKAIQSRLQSAGIKRNPRVKLSKLNRLEYRAVLLAAKTEADTKTVYVNFDGLPFGVRNRKKLRRFLSVWSKRRAVFVSVSDERFIPKNAPVKDYGGISKTETLPQKAVNRVLEKKNLELVLPEIKI